jgi:hypothetical protein
MISLARLFGVRTSLQRQWADTEVAPPDTVSTFDETDRAALAESEWFMEVLGASARGRQR